MHTLKLEANWNGAFNSFGNFKCAGLTSDISVPKEFGGKGVGTNPEELLLAAAANCYMITLVAVLQYEGINFNSINLNSIAAFEFNQGPIIKSIKHFSKIFVKQKIDENKIQRCILKAEESCMVSIALKGNVALSVSNLIEEL
ncbi:MAG TPA: OsmC family protein [Burkholderiales bacterium]|nr:OsmC family protein [Burkholderiales bacterium]